MTGSVQSKSACWLETRRPEVPSSSLGSEDLLLEQQERWGSRRSWISFFTLRNPDFSCILAVAALVSAPVRGLQQPRGWGAGEEAAPPSVCFPQTEAEGSEVCRLPGGAVIYARYQDHRQF